MLRRGVAYALYLLLYGFKMERLGDWGAWIVAVAGSAAWAVEAMYLLLDGASAGCGGA